MHPHPPSLTPPYPPTNPPTLVSPRPGNVECKVFGEDGVTESLVQYTSFRGEVQAPKTIMYPMSVDLGYVTAKHPPYHINKPSYIALNTPTPYHTPNQHTLLTTYYVPYERRSWVRYVDTPTQHTLLHSSQHALSTHPLNTPSQHTLPSQ